MSRLSDVIDRVVELETDTNGTLDVHRAVSAARPLLDADDTETLILEGLAKRIKDKVTRRARAVADEMDEAQNDLPFPDLRPAHAVDVDGRFVVNTVDMTEMQFRRVIEIRRKQLRDDRAYLDVLEQAYRQVEPIWRMHPDFTFRQVCRVLGKQAA